MRGRGLPGCGLGVVVPISRKPKPSEARASMCAPSLSMPAASPTGLANARPNTVSGIGRGRSATSGLSPVR